MIRNILLSVCVPDEFCCPALETLHCCCLFVCFYQSNAYLELCCVCLLQVFPPTFRELPGPALDLFDLDESFSSEKSRLAQITNKCKCIKPP